MFNQLIKPSSGIKVLHNLHVQSIGFHDLIFDLKRDLATEREIQRAREKSSDRAIKLASAREI